MKMRFFLFSVLLATATLHAQDNLSTADKEAAYNHTIATRADKIVGALNLSDSKNAEKVSELVADQYKDLNKVYTARDLEKKQAKEALSGDKEALQTTLKAIDEKTVSATQSLHKKFLKKLSRKLSPDQVDQIKDGMTYNVLHVTYSAYMSMLPNLSDEQKTQILAWLTEARENAMDAESSEKKHAWFGKYKGRINNYLSAAGYDMKKEGEAWQKRLAEEKKQKAG